MNTKSERLQKHFLQFSNAGRTSTISHPLLSLLGILVFMNVSYLLCYCVDDTTMISLANKTLPIILLLSLFWTAYKIIRAYPLTIWTPLPWFFFASGAYFGFGPLIYNYGDMISVWYCDQYYPVYEMDLLRTNFINCAGISIVLVGFIFVWRHIKGFKSVSPVAINMRYMRITAILFLAIGIPIKYLFYLPYIFGLTDFILPNSIGQLQSLTYLSIIPLSILIKNKQKLWYAPLFLLIASEIIVSTLEFSKLSIIITLLMVILGWFICTSQIRVLIFGFLLLISTYLLLTPLIPYGREKIYGKSGGFQQVDLRQRLSILLSYFPFGGTTKHGTLVGHQPWWSRLNYANAQTFAMNRYDQGQPGDSFKLAIYAPIPRFIWFNKPSITDVGQKFNYLATGNYFSSSAPGFFAEAYWNGGYAMVFIACFYVGVLFCCFTYYSIRKMGNNELLFLPIIFLGIKMGFRPDGWFVAEYIGVPLIAIFTHFALTWVLKKPTEGLVNSPSTKKIIGKKRSWVGID